jgi:hypothetical protein
MNDFVKAILPWIGTAIAGPLGGMAVKFFADKLGVPAEKAEDISQWLRGASPEDLLKAKNADQEFQVKMAEIGFKQVYDLEALSVQDRISARDREIRTGDKTTQTLAWVYSGGYFVLLGFTMLQPFPPANSDVLNALLGVLSAAELAIVQYYFGSSKGSSEKNEALLLAVKAK